MTQNGVCVEQRLRRVFVHAVSGIDDGNLQMSRHQQRRSRRGMANDHDIGTHRLQRIGGVEQRFSLLDARSAGEHQRGHRPHRLGRDFKRAAGPSRGLVKKQQHAFSAQQRTRLERIHPSRQLQQRRDLLRVEMFNVQQRTARSFAHHLPRTTARARNALLLNPFNPAFRPAGPFRLRQAPATSPQ